MLNKQISQLMLIDLSDLEALEYEINALEDFLRVEYSEYQSGERKTLTLGNPSGDIGQNIIYDGVGVFTSYMNHLPSLKKILGKMDLNFMWIRIAKLGANGFLWEHRDYGELEDKPRLRLHLPIKVNKKAQMQVENKYSVFMDRGFLWKLDPKNIHAVSNLGFTSRIHIIIDVYINKYVQNLISNEFLDSHYVYERPILNNPGVEIQKALFWSKIGYQKEAVNYLLKLYHAYDLSGKHSYDLVQDYYAEMGDEANMQLWKERKNHYLNLSTLAD